MIVRSVTRPSGDPSSRRANSAGSRAASRIFPVAVACAGNPPIRMERLRGCDSRSDEGSPCGTRPALPDSPPPRSRPPKRHDRLGRLAQTKAVGGARRPNRSWSVSGAETGEAVNLGVLDEFRTVSLHLIESAHPLSLSMRIGGSPAHATATGKILLAALDPAESPADWRVAAWSVSPSGRSRAAPRSWRSWRGFGSRASPWMTRSAASGCAAWGLRSRTTEDRGGGAQRGGAVSSADAGDVPSWWTGPAAAGEISRRLATWKRRRTRGGDRGRTEGLSAAVGQVCRCARWNSQACVRGRWGDKISRQDRPDHRGGRGIGATTALMILAEGGGVGVVDTNQDHLNNAAATAQSRGTRSRPFWRMCKRRTRSGTPWRHFVKDSATLTSLVNNAGMTIPRPFMEKTAEEWIKTLEVNLISVFSAPRRLQNTCCPEIGKDRQHLFDPRVEHCGREGVMDHSAAKGR